MVASRACRGGSAAAGLEHLPGDLVRSSTRSLSLAPSPGPGERLLGLFGAHGAGRPLLPRKPRENPMKSDMWMSPVDLEMMTRVLERTVPTGAPEQERAALAHTIVKLFDAGFQTE